MPILQSALEGFAAQRFAGKSTKTLRLQVKFYRSPWFSCSLLFKEALRFLKFSAELIKNGRSQDKTEILSITI